MADPTAIYREFPTEREQIDKLILSDPHFAEIVHDYEAATRDLEGPSASGQEVDQAAATELRKRRDEIQDEIARRLLAAGAR